MKRPLLGHGNYSSGCSCRTKILSIFRGIIVIFSIFKNSYVFITLLLLEPQTMFCRTLRFRGTLFEKKKLCYTVYPPNSL